MYEGRSIRRYRYNVTITTTTTNITITGTGVSSTTSVRGGRLCLCSIATVAVICSIIVSAVIVDDPFAGHEYV